MTASDRAIAPHFLTQPHPQLGAFQVRFFNPPDVHRNLAYFRHCPSVSIVSPSLVSRVRDGLLDVDAPLAVSGCHGLLTLYLTGRGEVKSLRSLRRILVRRSCCQPFSPLIPNNGSCFRRNQAASRWDLNRRLAASPRRRPCDLVFGHLVVAVMALLLQSSCDICATKRDVRARRIHRFEHKSGGRLFKSTLDRGPRVIPYDRCAFWRRVREYTLWVTASGDFAPNSRSI